MEFCELIDDRKAEDEEEAEKKEEKDRGHLSEGKKKYSEKKIWYVKAFYIFAIVLWIAIILFTGILRRIDMIGGLILLMAIVVFFVGYWNADHITVDVEEQLFRSNYLAVGLLIVIPLLTWINRDMTVDKKDFTIVIILSVIFIMLSLLDLWTKRGWNSVVKHVRSIFQTMAIVLLIYAFYLYYASTLQKDNLFS